MNEATPPVAGGELSWAGALLARMTRDEKAALLAGADMWHVPPLERLGVQGLVMSDGPSGVRGGSFVAGRSASFPAGVALAATWDPALVTEAGRALGQQAREAGVHVLLGPAVNLHRHPLAGRNFECWSEDPELTSQMACAYIAGVQSAGVACCVKHLVANDSEHERHTISSDVDEDVLRELYLTPFEEAVRAGVWSVMASYNRLNGTHTSEHPWLLTGLLRQEWGFGGAVISDWFGTHSTVAALAAGLDIEMPGPSRFRGQALLDAIEHGLLGEADLDRAALRVLGLIGRTAGRGERAGRDERTGSGERAGRGEGPGGRVSVREVIRTAGARGMVLLKNEGVLPLDVSRLRTLAVIGPLADGEQFQGGGSTQVNPAAISRILPALRNALGPGVTVSFERGCVLGDWPSPLGAPLLHTPAGEDGALVEYLLAASPRGEPFAVDHARDLQLTWPGVASGHADEEVLVRVRGVIHPPGGGLHRLVAAGTGAVRVLLGGELVLDQQDPPAPVAGIASGLGLSGTSVVAELEAGEPSELIAEFVPAAGSGLTRLEIGLVPPSGPDLLERAVAAARAADAVLVVAGSPAGWETEGRDRPAMALPGAQDDLIDAVCAVNPRTVVALNSGAPCSMPWAGRAGAIVQMWFPGQEIGGSLTDVLTGVVNPSGKLPVTFPADSRHLPCSPYYPGANGHVAYGERFSVGYRRVPGEPPPAPLFPFGHGLSYSRFELGAPQVRPLPGGADPGWEITVPVTNAEGPAGREVVQLYGAPVWPDRPVLELKGFACAEVFPGETATARITVARRRLRRWSGHGWEFPAGPVPVRIGTSSADLPLAAELPPLEAEGQPGLALQVVPAAGHAVLLRRKGEEPGDATWR